MLCPLTFQPPAVLLQRHSRMAVCCQGWWCVGRLTFVVCYCQQPSWIWIIELAIYTIIHTHSGKTLWNENTPFPPWRHAARTPRLPACIWDFSSQVCGSLYSNRFGYMSTQMNCNTFQLKVKQVTQHRLNMLRKGSTLTRKYESNSMSYKLKCVIITIIVHRNLPARKQKSLSFVSDTELNFPYYLLF